MTQQWPVKLSQVPYFPLPDSPDYNKKGMIRIALAIFQETDGSTREQFVLDRPQFVAAVVINEADVLTKAEFKYMAEQVFQTNAAGAVKIAEGETPTEAAAREALEEFGRKVLRVEMVESDLYVSPDKTTERQHIAIVYVGEEVGEREAGEITRTPLSEIRDLLKHPRMRPAMQRLALHEVIWHLGL